MFEATLEAQALNNNERGFRSLSTAIVAHATLILAIVFVTAMIVPPVTTPVPRPIIITQFYDRNLDLAGQKHDSPPPAGPKRPKSANQAVTPVIPRPIEQPVETPTTIAETAPTSDLPGLDDDGSEGTGEGTTNGVTGATGEGGGGGGGTDDTGGGSYDGPQPLTPDMIRPVLLSKVEPLYPKAARIARLGGRVVVEAVIGLDGRVESVMVLSSSNSLFDEAALAAVRQWTYTPARMNGSPVRVYFTVQVSFVLR